MSQPGLPFLPSVDHAKLLVARDTVGRLLNRVFAVQATAHIWVEYAHLVNDKQELEGELAEVLAEERDVESAHSSVCFALTREISLTHELAHHGFPPSFQIGGEKFPTAHQAAHYAGDLAVAFCIKVRTKVDAGLPAEIICRSVRSLAPEGFLSIDCRELHVSVSREWAAAASMLGVSAPVADVAASEPKTPPKWTSFRSPSEWAKLFEVQSWRTISRRIVAEEYTAEKRNGQNWRFDANSLPDFVRDKLTKS